MLNPSSQTWSWISLRVSFHSSTGPSRPNSSAVLMARSMATHAMTLEWVKCRRGPRTSQIPSSGSRHPSRRKSISESWNSQVGAGASPRRLGLRLGLVERRHHLAVDVELELAGGGVADAHGCRALVTREPVDLPLVEAALAGGPVHDLHLRGIAGDGPQQPVPPGHGLVVEAAAHQRLEGQRGVAQPAEPVVPVAVAAEGLGQRRGRGRHDPAGRLVGQRLQGDERPDHRLAVLALVGALGGPVGSTTARCPGCRRWRRPGAGAPRCPGTRSARTGSAVPRTP